MDLLASIIQSTLIYSTPIIIASLGGLFSERSGIVNIALEGLMMIGGFAAAASIILFERYFGAAAPWLSLLVGIVSGTLVSILHAYLSINFNSDQVVSGTAINIFAGGITIYLAEIIFNQQRTESFQTGFIKMSVPVLEKIPLIGEWFFSKIYVTVYLAFILVVVTWYLLYKTAFGLRFRGAGENPHAIDSLGINIYRIRYIGVLASGAFAGLAGGIMVLTQNTQYTITAIHGTGFIALAALIFGRWKPFPVLAAGLFFGFAQILSLYTDSIAENWNMPFLLAMPSAFYYTLPYALTVIALVVFSSKAVGPKAAGRPYEKGGR